MSRSIRNMFVYCFMLLLILAIMTAGCAPVATEAPAPEAGELPPIKIGVAGPTTGSAAAYGEVQLNGVEIAVTEINEAGGINGRMIEIVPGDDQCDPTQAANVAQRFTTDPDIIAVIGHVCSSATLAGGPIYDAAGLTVVTGSSTNPLVTEQGWTHLFRTITSDADQGPEIAKLGIEDLGLSKFAVMYANHDYGRGLRDYTVPAIEAMGGEVVAEETFAPGEATDFSAQLTKIAEADPEILVLLTDYAEGGLIAGQRMQNGLEDVVVISSAGNAHYDYIDLAGGEPAEGNLMVVYYNADSDDPATVEFNEKYMARWGELPTAEIPVFNYEVVYILKEAIEQGATRETMHEVLPTIEYHGPTGVTNFDEKGHTTGKGQSVIVIENGEFKTFQPEEMAAEPVPSGPPIKIGVAGPTTGSAAAYGEVQLNGVEIAVTEINEAGGINGRMIEIVPGDDQCDPTQAANVAQRFTTDPDIIAVIGHVCSSATLAGGPIYDAAGLTVVTGSSTNPLVTEQGWTHLFRTITSDADQGPEIAKLGIEDLGLSKFAVMYANHDYGRGLRDYTVPAIEAMGGEVVAEETFAPGEATDFSAQLTKIAEADPEILVLLTDYAEGGLIAGQRMQNGLEDVVVISSAGNAHYDYIDLAGGEPAEGNLMVVYYNADSDDPATVEFNEKYMARWGELPTAEIPVFNYEVVYILKEAIEQGATRETMHEVLPTIEYHGPTGVTNFDEKGHTTGKGQSVIVIENGEFKTFHP